MEHDVTVTGMHCDSWGMRMLTGLSHAHAHRSVSPRVIQDMLCFWYIIHDHINYHIMTEHSHTNKHFVINKLDHQKK